MKKKDDLGHLGIAEIYKEIRKVKEELQDLRYIEKKKISYLKFLEKSITYRQKESGRRLLSSIFKTKKNG